MAARSASIRKQLLGGVCVATLALGASQAQAQDAAAPEGAAAQEGAATAGADESDIVVTGIRLNLQSAQNRKRNAETVGDFITAEDIGSFPDKSVAEALQRVPGVTVVRFAGTTTPRTFPPNLPA